MVYVRRILSHAEYDRYLRIYFPALVKLIVRGWPPLVSLELPPAVDTAATQRPHRSLPSETVVQLGVTECSSSVAYAMRPVNRSRYTSLADVFNSLAIW